MRSRNGKHTVAEEARKMIEAGLGLSEAEIKRFISRVDAARSRQMKRGSVDEFRELIERRTEVISRSCQ